MEKRCLENCTVCENYSEVKTPMCGRLVGLPHCNHPEYKGKKGQLPLPSKTKVVHNCPAGNYSK